MKKPKKTAATKNQPPTHIDEYGPPPRNRMEIVRFKTPEDHIKAMGVFREYGASDVYFTFNERLGEDTCITNTLTVRAMKALGVNFDWLTEHA